MGHIFYQVSLWLLDPDCFVGGLLAVTQSEARAQKKSPALLRGIVTRIIKTQSHQLFESVGGC